MANMNFGVNILPKANNTYTLGNSDYKWNIFANALNGVSLTNIITDVQIDGNSIVSNNIATLPIASASDLGIIKVGNGLYMSSGVLYVNGANSNQIKGQASIYVPITPKYQHEAVFYGLAKAAGDSTQAASANAVGTYTDGAKTAIQNMLAVAPIANPEFTGSISLGRKYATTKGTQSIAVGYQSEATEDYSFAIGSYAKATATHARALGYGTLASADYLTVTGLNNIDTKNYSDVDNWAANTSYAVGDFAKIATIDSLGQVVRNVYKCTTAHTSGSTSSTDNWLKEPEYGFIIGNGESTSSRNNAFAVDWYGNGYFMGDVYANATFHTNLGVKLATINELPGVMTGATSSVAGTSGLVPAPAITDVDKFLAGDGTYKSGGLPMVILSYGNSTWQDFINAYNNNVIVYCRASSNSNPASGSQTRMAFMAYVNDASSPTNVEFQYYRSMNSHSATAMGDEVYVYKLTNASGGTWSVTTRKASIKEIDVASGSKLGVSWSSDKVTLSNTMTADDMPMSSSDATTAKSAIDTINTKLGSTTMGTTATTVTGAIAEHESDISTLNSNIVTKLETDGVIKLVKRFTFSVDGTKASDVVQVDALVSGRTAICAVASVNWYASTITKCTVFDYRYVSIEWSNSNPYNATFTGYVVVFYV